MTYTGPGEEGGGEARRNDPWSARQAAQTADIKGNIRLALAHLSWLQEPRNGWEISVALDRPTITIVNRLCGMRTIGLIDFVCHRPGPPPKHCSQMAYVITDYGRQALSDPIVWAEAITRIRSLDGDSPLTTMDKARVMAARLTDAQWAHLIEHENYRRSVWG